MTSQIVSASIDENFPIAGQDNDSQGFRDNFQIIKDGLATAASEITNLQTNTAKLNSANNFSGTLIENAQTNRLYGTVYSVGTTSGITNISFNDGEYQVITLNRNSNLRFQNWPAPEDNVYSKIKVAFKTDGTGNYTATFTTQGGTLVALEGSSDTYTTGTNPDIIKIVEAWTVDNGDTVYLTTLGDFSSSGTLADIGSIGNVDISVPTVNQVLSYNGTKWTNASLEPEWRGEEQVEDASSIDLTKTAGYFITGTVDEGAVLGAGQEGQVKVLVMDTDGGGNMVVNVTNPGWNGAGTVTFNAAGQGCTLRYVNNKWFCVGNNGAVFA